MAMTASFESALQGRIDAMIDACTRCGKCVEVCPATEPAGLSAERRQNPAEVIGSVIDLLRGSAGNDAARKWASGCLLSGECIKACDYGVNPRFLLGMARVAMVKAKDDAATQRRAGVEGFRKVARGVNALSRLQLDDALLAQLGQVPKQNAAGELPDFVFYIGCNVLKTPHIALLALDLMDALGISYEVMGGPTHCCGSLDEIAEIISVAHERGATVQVIVSTAWGCPYEGDVPPARDRSVAGRAIADGADSASFGDTTGMAAPTRVRALVGAFRSAHPETALNLHFHNTRGTGLANVLAALELGVSDFDASVGGLGGCPYAPGATGNIATEELVHMVEDMGVSTGIDLQAMISAAAAAERIVGRTLPSQVLRAGPRTRTIAP